MVTPLGSRRSCQLPLRLNGDWGGGLPKFFGGTLALIGRRNAETDTKSGTASTTDIFEQDRTAESLGNASDYGWSEPGAFFRRPAPPIERFQNPTQFGFRNARAAVFDTKDCMIALMEQSNIDATSVRCMTERIVN